MSESTESPLDVSMVEGTMEIGTLKTKGFRYYSILMVLLISLAIVLITCAITGSNPATYGTWLFELSLLALGVFTGKKA